MCKNSTLHCSKTTNMLPGIFDKMVMIMRTESASPNVIDGGAAVTRSRGMDCN